MFQVENAIQERTQLERPRKLKGGVKGFPSIPNRSQRVKLIKRRCSKDGDSETLAGLRWCSGSAPGRLRERSQAKRRGHSVRAGYSPTTTPVVNVAAFRSFWGPILQHHFTHVTIRGQTGLHIAVRTSGTCTACFDVPLLLFSDGRLLPRSAIIAPSA
jgi:hypothetical protein